MIFKYVHLKNLGTPNSLRQLDKKQKFFPRKLTEVHN